MEMKSLTEKLFIFLGICIFIAVLSEGIPMPGVPGIWVHSFTAAAMTLGIVIYLIYNESCRQNKAKEQEAVRKEKEKIIAYELSEQKERERVKLNGEIKIHYTNGNIESILVYKNDILIAPIIRYNEKGELLNGEIRIGDSIAQYKDGKKDGVEISFAPDGKITMEEHWKNGERSNIPKGYYKKLGVKDGTSYHRCDYVNGEPAGLSAIKEKDNRFI